MSFHIPADSPRGPNGEPLACAYPPGHEPRDHSWATLPTFVRGVPGVSGEAELRAANCEDYNRTVADLFDRLGLRGPLEDPNDPA